MIHTEIFLWAEITILKIRGYYPKIMQIDKK